MAETLAELRALSDEELIRRHDERAPRVVVATGHYRAELARRDRDRQTRAMLDSTRSIENMTKIITLATIVNVIATALAVYVAFVKP